MKFKDARVGDVVRFESVEFIKIGEYVSSLPMNRQRPNSLDLRKHHYCTVNGESSVKLVKTPDDFVGNNSYYDAETWR